MSKKILILSMSCNDPFFQGLLAAVKDTWAKPIIKGEYENVEWYGYTSCDTHHPSPCIDEHDHMIYVDSGDALPDTYMKTRKAWEMIKDLVDFDYVVRTNTSVFINVDKLIERVNSMPDTKIMCGAATPFFVDGKIKFWCCIGYCLGMTRELFEIAMSGDDNQVVDSFGHVVENGTNDDTVISMKLWNQLGENKFATYCPNPHQIVPMYKCKPDDGQPMPDRYTKKTNLRFANNPYCVNNFTCIRIRSIYEINRKSWYEVEHMFELYNHLGKEQPEK